MHLVLSGTGLALLVDGLALFGPPALPAGEPEANPAPPAADQPAPTPDEASPPATDDPQGSLATDAGQPSPSTAENELPSTDDASEPQATGDDPAPGLSPVGSPGSISASADVSDVSAIDSNEKPTRTDDDPGMVQGRREPMMPAAAAGVGLFHTSLPDVGGRYTFRFRLHTDFFRDQEFIYNGVNGPDEHARLRGGVALGFSPFKWGEVFFSVGSQANRNTRDQEDRQDAEAMFALGDINFGVKGAHRFDNGIGIGGQVGVGLLSGSERLRVSNVNFGFDALFSVDVRYLTKSHFPFRFTTNIGWLLDNSLELVDYTLIDDTTSAEVTRFSTGANHNRLRMRYAIDFPIRVGKKRQVGLDPIVEWQWDVSTQEEPFFRQLNREDSPLVRSSQSLTIGLRANVVRGLFLDAGVDIGLVSPNFEFGPRIPPWQMLLGLGWSFDPKPVVKKVEVQAEAPPPPPPPPVIEGRIIGQVVDPEGNPIPDAYVQFPGLTTSTIVTDTSGTFTSYRFPAGTIAVQIAMKGEVVHETTAEVVDGQDTNVTIALDKLPSPATSIVEGAFTDEQGNPVKVTLHVVGQGVDQPFDANESGLMRLLLYVGDYRATASADGFVDKSITFTVPEDGQVSLTEKMTRDKPPQTPNIREGKRSISLRRKVRYSGTDVATSSHPLLDELATFLSFHSEIELIEIGVHTDDRGAAKSRSDGRANSVKDYLVGKGISADRIRAKGHGASRPVAVNLTAGGRAKNNRTTIVIKKRSE